MTAPRPSIPLRSVGAMAALVCAGTYLIGFALLMTVLAPLNYGTTAINPSDIVAFAHASPGLLIAWNTTIYIVNAIALACLVVALSARLRAQKPAWADVTLAFGLIWAALVLAAGMIANVAVERAVALFPDDPIAAADLWSVLHAVELGLGGGNEIAGGVWILCVSLAGGLPRFVRALGLFAGVSGIATLVPALGDPAGAIFGLGTILWFLTTGVALLHAPACPNPRQVPRIAG